MHANRMLESDFCRETSVARLETRKTYDFQPEHAKDISMSGLKASLPAHAGMSLKNHLGTIRLPLAFIPVGEQ